MPLNVLIGTYNLNQRLLNQELTSWLFPLSTSSPSLLEKPDIIAIGFQEFNEYPNAFLNINSETRIKHCEGMIERAIYNCTRERYYQVTRSIFVGLALVIYVRDELINQIKDVEVEQIGVGPMWIGNKGAIVVRLIIFIDSSRENVNSVCFVCAHLAPHSKNVLKRNKDFQSIIQRLSTPYKKKYDTMYDNDYVFFFGDLNYRIELNYLKNPSLTISRLMNLLNTNQHQLVLPFDQLNIERKRGRVFNGFQEGEVKFSPTYKYYVDTFDSFNFSKRIPGWYHKPVSALFTINFIPPNIKTTNVTINIKIDKWRVVKKVIGNIFTRIAGLLWWLFGTRRGIKLFFVLITSILISWYFINLLLIKYRGKS
ncbi:3155_t:CDS:2 [Funneliformis mosseae]|uniref:3155_t:CDS:1 n=1 Tax=Funneliformis mosseae TaxID=27381 RepID=A0A9N8VN70_FUNMO|nr:3155_t:CDS:2 [Funneliformis mosseae]